MKDLFPKNQAGNYVIEGVEFDPATWDRVRSPCKIPWRPRGIGLDQTGGCFVCGATVRNLDALQKGNDFLNNICAFLSVEHEADALACFDRGAAMHYHHGDKWHPQIVVGSCDRHLSGLKELSAKESISQLLVHEIALRTMAREG